MSMNNPKNQWKRSNFLSGVGSSSGGNFLPTEFFRRRQGSYRGAGAGGANSRGLYYGLPPYIWITAGGTTMLITYTYYAYLEEVPFTHRKRWIATSPEMERQLGDQEYEALLRQFRGRILSPQHRASQTVQRVGSRIVDSALQFAREQNVKHLQSPVPYQLQKQAREGPPQFTYTVVRSDMANAFVLPGNHVFVFTGLFKYVRDEDDLAAVLGHEIAHNVARHAGEKISGSIVMNMFARLTLLFDPTGVLLMFLLPATKLFRELPHSRIQETEADEIGVHLAASACYDPRAAKRVFSAMKHDSLEEGKQPPEFLSTHPSHESRISNFDQWLPDAMALYNADNGQRCRKIRRDMELARRHAAAAAMMTGSSPYD